MKKLFIMTIFILMIQNGISQTPVSGGIYSNATWTLNGSPYNVIDNVSVFPGVTLTIEPGVVVRFSNSKSLTIHGHLDAIGNQSDSIYFIPASSTPTIGIWPGVDFSGTNAGTGVMKFCVFKYADHAINLDWGWGGNGPISVSHSLFYKNSSGIYGYGGFTFPVDTCLFIENDYGLDVSYFAISNSTFIKNTTIGIDGGSSSVINSYICGSPTGVKISGNLQNCVVAYNGLGVDYGSFPNDNIIVYNNTGIRVFSSFGTNNIICGNNNYNIANVNSNPIDASNNCWCSSDSLSIAQKIYDGYDNISLGLITFTPFLNCDTFAISGITNCIDTLTGVEPSTISEKNICTIYPNPFSSVATLMTNRNLFDATLTIYNAFGQRTRIIRNVTGQEIKLYRGNLVSGIYFILLVQDNRVIVKDKIIIE